MIQKIGVYLLDHGKLRKLIKLSYFLFFIGVLGLLALPYFSENLYVTEKIMRQSHLFDNRLLFSSFKKSTNIFFQKLNLLSEFNFNSVANIFEEFDNLNQEFLTFKETKENMFMIDINSPRGDQRKSIVINFVIENSFPTNPNLFSKNKIIRMMYVLCNLFNDKDNIQWLTKDMKILFTPKVLFYEKPKILTDLFSSDDRFLNPYVEYIVNLDLIEMHNFEKILIKVNGQNSELSDLDIYTTAYKNLSNDFKRQLTSNNKIFSPAMRQNLISFFTSVNNFLFAPFFSNHLQFCTYPQSYTYLLEFLIDNFIIINKVDFNSNIITEKGLNTFLIKALPPQDDQEKVNSLKENILTSKELTREYNFLQAHERMIISLSRTEITIFSGERHYILCTPKFFVGIGRYIFLTVLCIFCLFYHIIYTYSLTNYKGCKNLVFLQIILYSFSLYSLLEIERIKAFVGSILS